MRSVFRPHTFWQPLPRRAGACVALAAYLFAALGFPVPASARPGRAASGAPARPCGCEHEGGCDGACCCCQPRAGVSPQPAATSCCDAHPSAGDQLVPPCCADPSKEGTGSEGTAPGSDPRPVFRWHFGLSAPTCGGLKTLWVSTGAVLPPGPPLAWTFVPAPAGAVVLEVPSPLSNPASPPDPPPRRANA